MYKYRFYRFGGVSVSRGEERIGFSAVGNGGRNRELYFEGFACFRGFHGTSVYQLFIVDYTRLRRRFSRQRRFASAGELIYCRENCGMLRAHGILRENEDRVGGDSEEKGGGGGSRCERGRDKSFVATSRLLLIRSEINFLRNIREFRVASLETNTFISHTIFVIFHSSEI